ncbi:CopD family protein [Bordetella sp. 2513F-2]
MVWIKAVHLCALALWCAALVYLPAVFHDVGRAQPAHQLPRLHVMARLAFVYVASPAAVLAIVSGTALAYAAAPAGFWLHAKLTVVAALVLFHLYCGRVVTALDDQPRLRRVVAPPALALLPAALAGAVLWLVLAKPF